MKKSLYGGRPKDMPRRSEWNGAQRAYIGDRLKTLRLRRNWTQTYVGQVLGMSGSAVSKMETGHFVTRDNVSRLLALYQSEWEAVLPPDNLPTRVRMIPAPTPGSAKVRLLQLFDRLSPEEQTVVVQLVEETAGSHIRVVDSLPAAGSGGSDGAD